MHAQIIVTGKPVPVHMRSTHFELLHDAVDASVDGQIIVLQEGQVSDVHDLVCVCTYQMVKSSG